MTKSSIAGYGNNFPTAMEARLKFFETYSRPCTGYEMEEQMHGPMRAYNAENYIFLIGSEGEAEFEEDYVNSFHTIKMHLPNTYLL